MWIEMHSLMVSSERKDAVIGGGGAKWEKGEKALSHGDSAMYLLLLFTGLPFIRF
jgi:hypothetical protein